MNLLKSIFISSYMMLIMVLSGYAGWMLYHGGNIYGWGGLLLTSAPLLMVISYLMMFRNVARTSAHFPLVNVMALAGVGASLWAGYSGQAGTLPAALSLAGYVGFILYAYWFSTYGGRKPGGKLTVGAELPPFTLTSADGAQVRSAQLADKPSILIFYRGNWCPLCMAQIKELVGRYKEIEEIGVRIALISPQPHKNTQSLAKKFGVKFDFLTDKGNAAARALGIAQSHGLPMGMQMMGYDSETVLPTVIITNASGQVIWSHETDNYRIRPEPDVYLDVLRKNGLVAQAA